MTEVAPTGSPNSANPEVNAPATSQPPTPPTNPTNSSEPASPTQPEKLQSEHSSSLTTPSHASTVPNPTLTLEAECSDQNPPSFQVPATTTTTKTTTPPSAEIPKSAAPVAPPTSNPAPNPNVNHTKNMAPTPVTVQNSQNSSAKTEPAIPESSQISEQQNLDISKSEPTLSDSRLDSSMPQAATSSDNSTSEVHQHSSDPSSATKTAPSAPRPQLKRLPKVAKNRPDNARVFIGNLASEYTSSEDIIAIFRQYGTLIEEPVLRRSFGFVQYSSAEAAAKATRAEQGRIIGGIGIDLSIADNREVKKGTHVQNNTPFQHSRSQHSYNPMRGRVRERENSGAVPDPRKRRRSVSPASASRKGGVHPPQYRRFRPEPKNGIHLRILCMSPTAKGYAKHCENTFRQMTGLKADILNILAAGLGEALGRAMRDTIPYVMVVASKDVDDGTCTIRTLEKTGYEKSGRGNGVIPLREAVEVCLIERGVIAPANLTQQVGPVGVPNRSGGTHGGMQMNARVLPPQGGAQWLNQSHQMPNQMENAKPGWMTGPRAPHPANQGGQRPPSNLSPAKMTSPAPPGYGYGDGRPPYGHTGPPPGPPPAGPPPAGPPPPGPPPPPPHIQGQSDSYGRSGGPHLYEGSSGVGLGPETNQEYGRGSRGDQYQSHLNQASGYSERYGGNHQMGRGNSYGQPGGRNTEYDPANVIPSQRTTQPGGYPTWNRDQGHGGRDMYNGSVQGAGMGPPTSYQLGSQPYPNHMYDGNQGYNDRQGQVYGGEKLNQAGPYGDSQAQSYGERGGPNQYDSFDSGVPYRRDSRRNVNNSVNQQDARYGNEGYGNGSSGAYRSGGYQSRDNRGGWDQQHPPSMGPSHSTHGASNAGPMRYGNEPVQQSQPQSHGYGVDFRNAQNPYDGGRSSDSHHKQYNVGNGGGEARDPRGNQPYGGDPVGPPMASQQYPSQMNSGNNMQSQAPAQAPTTGAGTVDIGKLTNLISAFQQKQQQSSQQSRSQQQQQQQQQSQHQQQRQQPSHQHQQPSHGQPLDSVQSQVTARGMQGDRSGVAQFLQMPGVQQALQNIGNSRLGGYQGAYQQGMTQQHVGMRSSMGQNQGRGPDQGGHPPQGYYG